MKFKEKMVNKFGKTGLKIKKYSPELLIGSGLILGAVGTIVAAKQTMKVVQILEELEMNIASTEEGLETYKDKPETYSIEDAESDVKIAKSKAFVDVTLSVLPVVALETASVICVLSGFNILKKRHAALVVAYAGLQQSFEAYRNRVAEKYGEDAEAAIRHNLKEGTVKTIGENGKKQNEKILLSDGTSVSMYAVSIEQGHKAWDKDREYAVRRFLSIQNWANEKLQAKGYLFLNEVYDELGIDAVPEGQIVGWLSTHPQGGDGCVDMHITGDRLKVYVNPEDDAPCYLLDFNVDGPIIDMI